MKRICVINQKGGVGRTTTVMNLASGLAMAGKKVLVVDLDPQGNLSTCFSKTSEKDIYDVLMGDALPQECIVNVAENLDFISSKETLTKAEMILVGEPSRETFLRRKLSTVQGYDFVFLDCAPSLGLLNQNAILYADEIFITASTDILALAGLRNMTKAISKINEVFGHSARITKIIPTMYDKRNKVCKNSLQQMQQEYSAEVTTPVHVNSKLKEAPGEGVSIFVYDKSSRGAEDYNLLVNSVLGHEVELFKEKVPRRGARARARELAEHKVEVQDVSFEEPIVVE